MRYDLEILFHDYEKTIVLVHAEDLDIVDILEILKLYQFNPCYEITIKEGAFNNGNTKQ